MMSFHLYKEIGVPGENHQPAASHWQTLSHNIVSRKNNMWNKLKIIEYN
jgi:hypothetical protein